MNEKRFVLEISSFSGKHMKFLNILDNGKRLNSEDIVDLLNEQQDTIEQLQDLCGKSDYENAKLRIENKRLCDEIKLLKPTNIEQYEQIVQLQEENEKLKNKLNKTL